MMKAVVKTQRGKGNISIQEVKEPTPGPDEIKIEVKAAGICGSDIHTYNDTIKFPLRLPVTMGHEFCGIVAETGKNVKNFKPGDPVTSETAASVCGICAYCRTGNYHLTGSMVRLQNTVSFHRISSIDFPRILILFRGPSLNPLQIVCTVYWKEHIYV
jgi:L-iditol 2-dehydrogenase